MLTALIDGDVIAYKIAVVQEKPTRWPGGLWTLHADEEPAVAALDDYIHATVERLDATDTRVALTDADNFRHTFFPTYKGNRADTRKPMILPALRQHLIDKWGAMVRPGLEGDDILGILSTHRGLVKGPRVIVSVDKDFKTIPGRFFDTGRPEEGVVEITEAEADLWHLTQTLTGDATDGYPGCPGIGPKKAEAILSQDPTWAAVVAAYEKAGLTEADALVQARCARILRACDYDFKKKEPILWSPT